MELNEYNNIWVFVETSQGEAKSVGLELLTPARELANAANEKLVAIVLGDNNAKAIESVKAAKLADEIISVENSSLGYFSTDAFAYTMNALVEKRRSVYIFANYFVGFLVGISKPA